MKKLISILLFSLSVSHVHAEGILDDDVFGVSLIQQDVNLTISASGGAVGRSESAA